MRTAAKTSISHNHTHAKTDGNFCNLNSHTCMVFESFSSFPINILVTYLQTTSFGNKIIGIQNGIRNLKASSCINWSICLLLMLAFYKQLQETSIKLCSKSHEPSFPPKVSSSEQQGVPLDTLFYFHLINNISCTPFPWKLNTMKHI